MEIVRIEAYKITELESSAKERALAWLEEGLDYEWWNSVYDDAKAVGKCLGIEVDDIYFSGFYHQGSGCCFSGNYSYRKGWKKALKGYAPNDKELLEIGQALQDIQRPAFYELGGEIKGNERYWRTRIDLHWQYSEHEQAINDVLSNFADWIYNNLQTEYEWLTSEEQLIETAEANGYLFDESGRII